MADSIDPAISVDPSEIPPPIMPSRDLTLTSRRSISNSLSISVKKNTDNLSTSKICSNFWMISFQRTMRKKLSPRRKWQERGRLTDYPNFFHELIEQRCRRSDSVATETTTSTAEDYSPTNSVASSKRRSSKGKSKAKWALTTFL